MPNLKIKPLCSTLVAVMKNASKWLAATPRLGLERGRLYDESLVVAQIGDLGTGVRGSGSGIGHYRHR